MRCIAVWCLLCALLSFRAEGLERALSLDVRPDQDCYAIGVPIVLELTINNTSDRPTRVDFGVDGLGRLLIEIENHGEKKQLPPYRRGGIAVPNVKTIASGENYQRTIILDELICLREAGQYQLSIALVTDEGIRIRGEARISILPELAAKLESLWQEFTNDTTTPERKRQLLSYFAFGRRQEFGGYQIRLMTKANALPVYVVERIASALLESGEDRGLESVLQNALGVSASNRIRNAAIYALSKMPQGWWDKKRAEMFGKFEGEIKAARPHPPCE